MNIDEISPSILHVTAKENLNIQDDLNAVQTKTIDELINEEKEKNNKTNKEESNG